MRESYRDKQNRKSRIAREKMENFNNRNKKNHRKNNEKGGQPESCPRKPGGRLFRLLYAYET